MYNRIGGYSSMQKSQPSQKTIARRVINPEYKALLNIYENCKGDKFSAFQLQRYYDSLDRLRAPMDRSLSEYVQQLGLQESMVAMQESVTGIESEYHLPGLRKKLSMLLTELETELGIPFDKGHLRRSDTVESHEQHIHLTQNQTVKVDVKQDMLIDLSRVLKQAEEVLNSEDPKDLGVVLRTLHNLSQACQPIVEGVAKGASDSILDHLK